MGESKFSVIRKRLRSLIRVNRRNYSSPRFDTSDVVQESMIQVVKELDKSPHREEVSQSWLQKIAFGNFIKHLRFHSAACRATGREEGKARFATGLNYGTDPSDALSKSEMIQKAVGSLSNLSDQQRQIVCLRFFEEATYDEIAAKLQISVNSVRSGLNAALEFIQAQMTFDHDS